MKASLLNRLVLLLIVLILAPEAMMGQLRFSEGNADCTGAITLKDTLYGPTATIRGFGNVLEISGHEKEEMKFFEREHNSVWFKFTTPWASDLTFDIIPEDPQDDIDFLLFEANSAGICDKVVSGEAVPIRSNISRKDPELGSMTGLDLNSFEPYVAAGIGSPYSMSVMAKAGQQYYLVIDYPQRPISGFSIQLHYGSEPITEPIEAPILKRQQVVHIRLFDEDSKEPLKGAIAIEGMVYDSIVSAEGMSDYTFVMDHYKKLRVNSAMKGYLLHREKVSGSGEPVVQIDLHLKKIEPGRNVILDDIHFVGNKDKVMDDSMSALDQLLAFMEENPTVSIEIQGHVNGPGMKNKKEFISLSSNRAKTIHDYLVSNEIPSTRLRFKGYGNERMIYPEARTKHESEANRRVEIEVISK